AVFCTDAGLDAVLRSIRVHGSGSEKYDNVRLGINGRLDTIQAAILLTKLTVFADELVARARVAERYAEGLEDVAVVPRLPDGSTSAWAQYTLRVGDRDGVADRLRAEGVPTAVYYPRPLHRQTAYKEFPCAVSGLEISERLADEVLSLPMHPYLTEQDQDLVIAAVRRAVTD
ncbi:MAG: DegT/DnrJ/EryC1/StrS family aminotransferase, partial [Actinobacteria bacterium]|nr:DegT/DnrJ/EryC1/StrS family aminotransferase [Actinomycetota bacterium]